MQARCCNACILGAWDSKRNPKPRVWLLSSPRGGQTLLAEHRSARKTEPLSSFKPSWRNVKHDAENKGVGGREDTNFQQISSLKVIQRLQAVKTWDIFFNG